MNKNELRKQLKQQRQDLFSEKSEQKKTIDHQIVQRLYSLWNTLDKDTIFAYSAFGGEVDLSELFRHLRKQKKTIALPKIYPGGRMEFFAFEKEADLVLHPFGMKEPRDNTKPLKVRDAVILVPGLGFDKSGGRIGFGGGYYDRYLAKAPQALKIGVCYQKQLVSQLPMESWDAVMDWIVTENEVIRL